MLIDGISLDKVMELPNDWVEPSKPNPLAKNAVASLCASFLNKCPDCDCSLAGQDWRNFRQMIQEKTGRSFDSRLIWGIFNKVRELADEGTAR